MAAEDIKNNDVQEEAGTQPVKKAKAFEDDDGNLSITRIVWAITIIVIVGTWSGLCFMEGELFNFTIGDATLFGLLFGGKVGSKFAEKYKKG